MAALSHKRGKILNVEAYSVVADEKSAGSKGRSLEARIPAIDAKCQVQGLQSQVRSPLQEGGRSSPGLAVDGALPKTSGGIRGLSTGKRVLARINEHQEIAASLRKRSLIKSLAFVFSYQYSVFRS